MSDVVINCDAQGFIYETLNADATFRGLMHTHESAAAIFASYQPQKHNLSVKPSAIIDTPFIDDLEEDSTNVERTVSLNIRLNHRPEGQTTPLVNAAARAKAVLYAINQVAWNGAVIDRQSVEGPTRSPTGDTSVDGVELTVTLHIKES